MSIRARFNIVLTLVFLLGFIASIWLARDLLIGNARDDVRRNANLLMETAMAVRDYTVSMVKPPLEPLLANEFLPQTVPAFAAVETFERLRKKYPEYSYREATLNPTNLRDLASDWESTIIEKFRKGATADDIVGERMGEHGPMLYIARPIQIKNPACLACHTSPDAAPASLIAKYGSQHGFGWQLNEVVGAQIISVPVALPIENAEKIFYTFAGVLLTLFITLFVVLNLMLETLVIKPLSEVCRVSDLVSRGQLDLPEFEEKGSREIARLHASFNRMRRSIEKAMRVLSTPRS